MFMKKEIFKVKYNNDFLETPHSISNKNEGDSSIEINVSVSERISMYKKYKTCK